MTAEELKLTIELLRNQLKPLMKELEIHKEATKNYEDLLNQAEGAFLKKEYLESFLIQSCIIEGILKEYAKKKLLPIISQSNGKMVSTLFFLDFLTNVGTKFFGFYNQ